MLLCGGVRRPLEPLESFGVLGLCSRHVESELSALAKKRGILATYSLDCIFDDLLVLQKLQVFPVLLVLLLLVVLLL